MVMGCSLVCFQYNGANIQLLDLPGIIEGAAQGEVLHYLTDAANTRIGPVKGNLTQFFCVGDRHL